MYEDLVKRLRETSMDFGEDDHVSVMLLEAADAIEELSGLVDHYGGETGIKNLQEYASKYWDLLKNAPRWIPVTERLPKINSDRYSDDLIVCMRRFDGESYYYEKFAGYLTSGNIWYTYQHDSCSQVGIEQHMKHYRSTADVIVAWMPMPSLPELPKEET